MFAEHLEEHVGTELTWLQRMYESQTVGGRGLSLTTVTQFFAWNREVCPSRRHPCNKALGYHGTSRPLISALRGFLLSEL